MGSGLERDTAKMKLLICTQAVDQNDSNLGFFVRWIEEFAKKCESVTVICLREGEHTLPANVSVYKLGSGKIVRSVQFLKLIFSLRGAYDAVFVHMNPEYVVLGGIFWRAWGKGVALWYTHKSVTLKLRIATRLVNTIFTASKESFRLKTDKLHVMGHGIDTVFFSPEPSAVRSATVLSVGRLSKAKRHDLVIEAAQFFPEDLWIAGDGPEEANLKELTQNLSVASRVHFLGGRTQAQLRELYRHSKVLIHASETGSLDKVVLEALACGLSVITTSSSLSGIPAQVVDANPKAVATVVANPPAASPEYVREHHSLSALIPRILAIISHD